MLRKNKMFILEKSKHITSMILWFPELEYTIDDENISKSLDQLREKFDLFFVFPQELNGVLDLEKFSNLHMATGYVISEDNDPSQSMWWTMKYLREFRKNQYLGYYLGSTDCINLEINKITDLEGISNSTKLNIGIMEYSRESYSNIYNLSRRPEKKDLIFKWKYLGTDPRGMYSTHTCNSDFIYLRPFIIDRIDEFMKGDAEYTVTPGHLFLDSFSGQWVGDFIASWVMKTDDPSKYFLNMKLKDVKA